MEPSDSRFCHPYEPYEIQIQFMLSLYQCLENGNVGIFESPTGTGKSLSLICAALTWLRDHKRRCLSPEDSGVEQGQDSDWLMQAERDEKRRDLLRQREELERKLRIIRQQDQVRNAQAFLPSKSKKIKYLEEGHVTAPPDGDNQYSLDDYLSDDDRKKENSTYNNGLSDTTQALLSQLQTHSAVEEPEIDTDGIKVIFCSRTHSQLAQFVNELKKVNPPLSIRKDERDSLSPAEETEIVKHLSLGSRKSLCINPKVASLASTSAINEACMELQKPGISKEKKCSFLPTKDQTLVVEKFRNRVLAKIQDIEDIGKLGKEMAICPYYASRSAIAPSEVLTLPYPLLLQKSAREALGVSMKNNIIIIDEAHNLMDAIADTCSVTLHLDSLDLASAQLTEYVQKFRLRLKGKNRVYVAQVIRLLNAVIDCARQRSSSMTADEMAVSPADLMMGKGVDQIKPHKLIQYLQQSKLAYKVDGYADSKSGGEKSVAKRGILMDFQIFLIVLMNPEAEGRFFLNRNDQDISVRYTLLDPTENFRVVVQEARAVILAGGTMSPMSDYSDHLFSYLASENLKTFSFGHVIPKENLFIKSIAQGSSDSHFAFTFERRKSETMILDLGQTLVHICQDVPDGVVVFFPSYEYLNYVVNIWRRLSAGGSIFQSLLEQKPVFEESKATAVDELLRNYSAAVDSGKGGLLLSVVGGKLSEGINFSDKLGRAVVAVGLPFPNINGAEWKAKIGHIENSTSKRLQSQGMSSAESTNQGKIAGREFYENACMRAINQCIGRAIRHKNDYAAILLVDKRYATDRIHQKLPLWIRDSMTQRKGVSFKEARAGLRGFFAGKV